MTDFAITDDLFFNRAGLDQASVEKLVDQALGGADDLPRTLLADQTLSRGRLVFKCVASSLLQCLVLAHLQLHGQRLDSRRLSSGQNHFKKTPSI